MLAQRTLDLACLIALALALACEKSSSAPAPEASVPTWQHSEAALEQAIKDGKPALLDLTATWCAPCAELEKVTLADKGVLNALSGWVLVRLDVTRQQPVHRELQEKYNALNLPAVILFDAAGTEIHRFDRLVGPPDVIAALERIAIPAK